MSELKHKRVIAERINELEKKYPDASLHDIAMVAYGYASEKDTLQ